MITDIEEARKIAERVIEDVALYNRDKIRRSLRRDALFDDLKNELDEARNVYLSKVDAGVEIAHNLFNRAVVDIIIKPFAHEETTIW